MKHISRHLFGENDKHEGDAMYAYTISDFLMGTGHSYGVLADNGEANHENVNWGFISQMLHVKIIPHDDFEVRYNWEYHQTSIIGDFEYSQEDEKVTLTLRSSEEPAETDLIVFIRVRGRERNTPVPFETNGEVVLRSDHQAPSPNATRMLEGKRVPVMEDRLDAMVVLKHNQKIIVNGRWFWNINGQIKRR